MKENPIPKRLHAKFNGGKPEAATWLELLGAAWNEPVDQGAKEELARRLDVLVRDLSRKCCNVPEEIRKDIAQIVLKELFLKTLIKDPELGSLLRRKASEPAIVQRIRNNILRTLEWRIKDFFRKELRYRYEPLLELDEMPGVPPSSGSTGRAETITPETIRELLSDPEIARKIPSRQWEIVNQMITGGISATEVAKRMNQSRSTVHRAIRAVADVLREEIA